MKMMRSSTCSLTETQRNAQEDEHTENGTASKDIQKALSQRYVDAMDDMFGGQISTCYTDKQNTRPQNDRGDSDPNMRSYYTGSCLH